MDEAALKDKLTPGEHPEGKALSDLRPCGKCDGVIYFGAREISELDKDNKVSRYAVVPSKEREALRYLRPMPVEWLIERKNREIGVSMPEVDFLYTKDMLRAAEDAGVPLKRVFTAEKHCIFAVQPQHRERWKVFQVEPGVWAVLYL